LYPSYVATSWGYLYNIVGGREMTDYRISYLISNIAEELPIEEAEKIMQFKNGEIVQELEKFNLVSSEMFDLEITMVNGSLKVPSELSEKWVDIFFNSKRD
jgi:hypothetical protein